MGKPSYKTKMLASGSNTPTVARFTQDYNPNAAESVIKKNANGFGPVTIEHDIQGELEAQAWMRKVGIM